MHTTRTNNPGKFRVEILSRFSENAIFVVVPFLPHPVDLVIFFHCLVKMWLEFQFQCLLFLALNSFICADVPLRNYSIAPSATSVQGLSR